MDSSIIVLNSAALAISSAFSFPSCPLWASIQCMDSDLTVFPNRFSWVNVSSMSLDVTWGLCRAWRVACECVKITEQVDNLRMRLNTS